MAKKKAVEPPKYDKETLIKELQAKRELASAQEQIAIDLQLANLDTSKEI